MPYQKVRDCSIFYEDFGIGEPILFLHSGYSRGIIAFSGQIQPFFHSFRCLMPDFRGHGRTISENKDWDTQIIADDMIDFLKELQIEKVHLIGYSLGGGVALHMAAKYSHIIKSITVIGCSGIADSTGAKDYEPEALIHDKRWDFIELIKVTHAQAHGGDWEHHMRQSVRDWCRYPNLTEEDWSKLTMKMLCIAGENDTLVPRKRLTDIQKKCPRAQILIVPGYGHRPHMPTDNVKEVNQKILQFLQE